MKRLHGRRILLRACVVVIFLAVAPILSLPSVAIAQDSDAANLATSLLVISFLLSVCILVVSGFSLWQSHKYYLDTVRLSQEITGAMTELHQKVLELIYSQKTSPPHDHKPVPAVQTPPARPHKSEPSQPRENADRVADSIKKTEEKIRSLEKTLSTLNRQFSPNLQPNNVTRRLTALSDVEYAVLLKLVQDPRFFEKHSFTSFGATPKVLDSLLSRQLIVFNRDGKAEVPKEVAAALKYTTPDN